MKKLFLLFLLSCCTVNSNSNDAVMLLRTNGDIDSIDISKQDPQVRKILHKIAYEQYLKYNEWSAFKASFAACSIVAAISVSAVYYATR